MSSLQDFPYMIIDQILITKIQEGDQKSLDQVFLHYYLKVKLFINGIIHQKEDSENISQDLFVQLWRSRTSLAHIQNFDSYLFTMAKHAAFHYLRKEVYHSTESIELPKETDSALSYHLFHISEQGSLIRSTGYTKP